VEVVARGFRLLADVPPEGRPADPKPVDQVLETAREEGVPLRRPDFYPFTVPAMELTALAEERGCFARFHRAVYTAYFARGEDIGRREVLLRLAEEAGLDPAEAESALLTGRYRPRVERDQAEAQALGLHAIPTFQVGRFLFPGLPPYAFLARLVERALEGRVPGLTEEG